MVIEATLTPFRLKFHKEAVPLVYQDVNQRLAEREDWVLRRQRKIPNNKKLWVLACMDERLPVEEALGIGPGDAHIFRNAGGLVTDDAIRSAMLSTNFFGTEEIIILNHTECGMMSARTEDLVATLRQRVGSLGDLSLDPALPELKLEDPEAFGRWIKMFNDVDATSEAQVALLQKHPLIPKNVRIRSYVYEVETGSLRHPHRCLANHINTSKVMIEDPLTISD